MTEPHRRGKVQLVDATSFYRKMRKSLGQKRHEIGEDQRESITRLYGGFVEGEHVRLFDNGDFGYHRITVERPLRLNFAVTDERLERVRETSAFVNLATSRKRKAEVEYEVVQGRLMQDAILAALESLRDVGVVKNRDDFEARLGQALGNVPGRVPAQVTKAILTALAERDESADLCVDARGNPEPDPELRDFENVPLEEDVGEYMRREVLPHLPDAWVDESKTKVGYEISFNRYFYTYEPPRPLEEIEAELREIEREIAEMLAGMVS